MKERMTSGKTGVERGIQDTKLSITHYTKNKHTAHFTYLCDSVGHGSLLMTHCLLFQQIFTYWLSVIIAILFPWRAVADNDAIWYEGDSNAHVRRERTVLFGRQGLCSLGGHGQLRGPVRQLQWWDRWRPHTERIDWRWWQPGTDRIHQELHVSVSFFVLIRFINAKHCFMLLCYYRVYLSACNVSSYNMLQTKMHLYTYLRMPQNILNNLDSCLYVTPLKEAWDYRKTSFK